MLLLADSNFESQDFIITITGQNPDPFQFGGSLSGTKVTLNPGFYEVTEDISGVDGRIVVENDNKTLYPIILSMFSMLKYHILKIVLEL